MMVQRCSIMASEEVIRRPSRSHFLHVRLPTCIKLRFIPAGEREAYACTLERGSTHPARPDLAGQLPYVSPWETRHAPHVRQSAVANSRSELGDETVTIGRTKMRRTSTRQNTTSAVALSAGNTRQKCTRDARDALHRILQLIGFMVLIDFMRLIRSVLLQFRVCTVRGLRLRGMRLHSGCIRLSRRRVSFGRRVS